MVDSLSVPTEPEDRRPSTKVDFLHPATPEVPLAKAVAELNDTPAPAVPMPSPAAPSAPLPPPPVPTMPSAPRRGHGWVIAVAIVVVLLAVAGGAGYWWYTTQREDVVEEVTPTPPPAPSCVTCTRPDNLVQASGDGKSLSVGAAHNKATVQLSFQQPAKAGFAPEVEVVPVGQPFTGTPTAAQPQTASGDSLVVIVSNLAEGQYHWQARFTDDQQVSPWVSYGGNDETVADFVIDLTAPAAPVLTNVGGKRPARTTTTVTTNRPTFTGTAEAASNIKVDLTPGPVAMTVTADASGGWTVTPDTDVPNGNHTVTITATDAAGNASTATYQLAVNAAQAAAPTATPPAATPTPGNETLPKTGDPAHWALWVGVGLLLVSVAGLRWGRQRHA